MHETTKTFSILLVSLCLSGPAYAQEDPDSAYSTDAAQQEAATADQGDAANQDGAGDSGSGYAADTDGQDAAMSDASGDAPQDDAADNTQDDGGDVAQSQGSTPDDSSSASSEAPAVSSAPAQGASGSGGSPQASSGNPQQQSAHRGANDLQKASQAYSLDQQTARQNMNDYGKYVAAQDWPDANRSLQQANRYAQDAQKQRRIIARISEARRQRDGLGTSTRLANANAYADRQGGGMATQSATAPNRARRDNGQTDDRRRYQSVRDRYDARRGQADGARRTAPRWTARMEAGGQQPGAQRAGLGRGSGRGFGRGAAHQGNASGWRPGPMAVRQRGAW